MNSLVRTLTKMLPSGDPLVIHDPEGKHGAVDLGIKAISGHIYNFSGASVPAIFGGHT